MTDQQQSIAGKSEYEKELERQKRARRIFIRRGQWAWVRIVDQTIAKMEREGKVS